MFWMDEGGERLRQTEIEGYKNKERERERCIRWATGLQSVHFNNYDTLHYKLWTRER